MALPTKLLDLSGQTTSMATVQINLADLRDEQGQRIEWLPGDLAVLDFDRPDVAVPVGWTAGGRTHGHTVTWRWLTPADHMAEFYLPTAELTEWRGYIMRNVEPAEVIEGSSTQSP